MTGRDRAVARDVLLDIVRSGVLAPSADNRHVVRFELTETAIRLWPTPEFSACTDRLRRVLGLMSIGAVVENMRLRAGELGLAACIQWSPAGAAGPIAQMDPQPSSAPADDLAQAIPDRHTNRRMFRGPRLDANETDRLAAAVEGFDGVRLVWLQGDARRRALKLVWLAESERFLRRRLHEDLFSSIRFDLGWHESASLSIPPGALEVEAPLRPMFKALRRWELMKPLTWVGVHRLLGLRAAWLPCWQAPALGVLTTAKPAEQGAIEVGAAFERLWLQATRLDLALQAMAGSVVLPLQTGVEEGVSHAARTALAEGWQAIAPGVTPLMLFRIGRAKRPTATSGRLPVEEHLTAVAETDGGKS